MLSVNKTKKIDFISIDYLPYEDTNYKSIASFLYNQRSKFSSSLSFNLKNEGE
jgi:hypothetical protein